MGFGEKCESVAGASFRSDFNEADSPCSGIQFEDEERLVEGWKRLGGRSRRQWRSAMSICGVLAGFCFRFKTVCLRFSSLLLATTDARRSARGRWREGLVRGDACSLLALRGFVLQVPSPFRSSLSFQQRLSRLLRPVCPARSSRASVHSSSSLRATLPFDLP